MLQKMIIDAVDFLFDRDRFVAILDEAFRGGHNGQAG